MIKLILDNDGVDNGTVFFDTLKKADWEFFIKIKNDYPEQYLDYLKKKKVNKFNL